MRFKNTRRLRYVTTHKSPLWLRQERSYRQALITAHDCGYGESQELESPRMLHGSFHTYLEDIGPDAFQDLGMEQLKQWSDASHGYTIAMKYGAPIYGVNLPLLVTSNYKPTELLRPDQRFPMTEAAALVRRFEIIHIKDLLTREGVELKSKEELKELKKTKNADFGLCFKPLTPSDSSVSVSVLPLEG